MGSNKKGYRSLYNLNDTIFGLLRSIWKPVFFLFGGLLVVSDILLMASKSLKEASRCVAGLEVMKKNHCDRVAFKYSF